MPRGSNAARKGSGEVGFQKRTEGIVPPTAGYVDIPNGLRVNDPPGEDSRAVVDAFERFQRFDTFSGALEPESVAEISEGVRETAVMAGYAPSPPFCTDETRLVEVEPGVYRIVFQAPSEQLNSSGFWDDSVGGLSEIIVDTNQGVIREHATYYEEEWYANWSMADYERENGFGILVAGGQYPEGMTALEAVNWHKAPVRERFGLGTPESRAAAYYLIEQRPLSPETAYMVARHPDPHVRAELARHFDTHTVEVQHALIDHRSPTEAEFEALVSSGLAQPRDYDRVDASHSIGHFFITKVTKAGGDLGGFSDANNEAHACVARNPLDAEVERRLAGFEVPKVREELAVGAKHAETLGFLGGSQDASVRVRVAANKHTSAKTLRFLGEDKDYSVSREANRNPNYPGFFRRLFL